LVEENRTKLGEIATPKILTNLLTYIDEAKSIFKKILKNHYLMLQR
jgi:hypothetical protein